MAQVEIKPEITGPDAPTEETASPEKDSAAAASSPSPGVESDSGERPSGLPEKFNSWEDMARAYSELEKKQGTPQPETEVPALTGKADPLITSEELQGYAEEYAKGEGLSEDTYKKLEAKGFDKSLVDSYVQGQIALAKSHQQAVFDVAGGKDGYMELITWANENLSKDEAAAADKIIQSGDFAAIQTTLNGLQARRQADSPPALQVTGNSGPAGGVKPFKAWSDVSVAMRDPRYDTDTSYREEVEARLAASDL